MAIIKYPGWLPLAQRASKNLTFQTPFRKDTPAVGAPIFQKLTTDIAATWSLTWVFTLAEERAFIQWLRSPNYLNKANNWFTMMIDLGGSGLQEQTLHFTDYPVQTSIDGGVVTWTGNVIAKKLNNTMDEFDDVLVELDYRWYSWLDEVVNRELPQVYMTPILHMPINMLSSTLDSRIIYDGPQIYYINRNGSLVQSAANEWPLTFINGVAAGRVPPEAAAENRIKFSDDFSNSIWTGNRRVTITKISDSGYENAFSLVVPNSENNNHQLGQNVLLDDFSPIVLSVFVKPDGYNIIRLRLTDSISLWRDVVINISTGDKISGTGGYHLAEVGNGWKRLSLYVSPREEAGLSNIIYGIWIYSNDGQPNFSGDGESGILAYGAQVEIGNQPSSLIATESNYISRPPASAKVAINGATSIDITYSDGSVVNVTSVDDYATIPQADSAWGSKYITTIKFNV